MPRPTQPDSAYLPALDGLRAVAVTLVVLYHLHVPGFDSGLLGVGVFFTLSGYLITSILLHTRARDGRVDLKRFWIARARRLLPALLLVLGTSLAATAIVAPDHLWKYSKQAFFALFYVNNWSNIASSESYFDRFGGPGPFDHLWSLSIEEQFYIIWPPLLIGLLITLRRKAYVTLAILVLAAGSFVLLGTIADAGFDNTRAYEGTDTRAGGLLVGAALALWWPARSRTVSHNARCVIDVAALVGLGLIVYLVTNTPDGAMSLYTSGIALLSVATAAVLIATAVPGSLVATVLAVPPLRWIGERSYGIYLWHMPMIAFVPAVARTSEPVLTGVIVIVATLVLSAVSWRFVEDPIRRHGLVGAIRLPLPTRGLVVYQFLSTIIDAVTRLLHSLTGIQARLTPPTAEPVAHPRTKTDAEDETPDDIESASAETVSAQAESTETAEADSVERAEVEERAEVDEPEANVEPAAADEPAEIVSAETGSAATDDGVNLLLPEVIDGPPTAHLRRRMRVPQVAVSLLVVAALAIGSLLAVHALRGTADEDDTATVALNSVPLPPASSAEKPSEPTLPVTQRRTDCTTVVHIGDSTSIGMNDPELLPVAGQRIVGRYQQVGARKVIPDIVGARSSMEVVNGQPNAVTAIEGFLRRGVRGCWVMAMGINDTANVEVGGQGPVDMRIDRLLAPLKDQRVLWPTVITSRLNENPAYSNRAMRAFNRALLRACERYPNLRLYDWAGEAKPSWFIDGIHYTAAGYIQRAYRFSIALASVFPASGTPPGGCVLASSDVTEIPPVATRKPTRAPNPGLASTPTPQR